MLKKIILFPYYLVLKIRHSLYDHGIWKVSTCDVPTICVGNIAAGGTGKTPHTEMILRTLLRSERWADSNIAVLSRGHKRKSSGFQQVTLNGTASFCGDEPLQIKKKFPSVTVAVDRSRVEGCHYLCNPEQLDKEKGGKKCKDKAIPPANLIVLDDAFQYRTLRAYINIVLVDYNRPVNKDALLPLGRLRDLPSRIDYADIILVTKCPAYIEDEDRLRSVKSLSITDYNLQDFTGTNRRGKKTTVLFSSINYKTLKPVYEEGDTRFIYSKKLILFSGIAKDTPLRQFLSDKYKIVRHFKFEDHHKYSGRDIKRILNATRAFPTAVVATTEKDSQRVLDSKKVPVSLKEKLFQVPIEVDFITEEERLTFENTLLSALERFPEGYISSK